MSELKKLIQSKAAEYFSSTRSIREHLHAHPELSFQEYKTSEYICAKLDELKIDYKKGYVKTGIVALIKGKNPAKKVIALRADMDALPIEEKNTVAYKSKNEGVMHACGHDVHSACLLGAARILNELKDEFEGTVKLIFQPGEEVLPGGASLMIKEKVLEDPKVGSAFGQHVFPSMETGKVGFRSGMYMASTDELYITVNGKGGHAAMVNEYINPLLIASEIMTTLNEQFMKQGYKDASGNTIPTVLAFGKIEGKGATNVIPDKVELQGTFRTMNEERRDKAHAQLKETVNAICEKWKANAEVKILRGYPFLVNNEALTEKARTAAIEYLGKENVEELPMRMTAEDFAYFTQVVPSCFYRLGTGNKAKGITSGVHTATFDIDERALEIGSGLMAWIALSELIT
ncbi:MAG: M20 family metallopeptidase [Bacteroidia bacterium]